jgi:hypothetical protein
VICLRRGGFQTAQKGARVTCEVLRQPKGLQAFRIRAMDEFDGGPSVAIAATDPCYRSPGERLGKSGGEVVQSATWIWISHP